MHTDQVPRVITGYLSGSEDGANQVQLRSTSSVHIQVPALRDGSNFEDCGMELEPFHLDIKCWQKRFKPKSTNLGTKVMLWVI